MWGGFIDICLDRFLSWVACPPGQSMIIRYDPGLGYVNSGPRLISYYLHQMPRRANAFQLRSASGQAIIPPNTKQLVSLFYIINPKSPYDRPVSTTASTVTKKIVLQEARVQLQTEKMG